MQGGDPDGEFWLDPEEWPAGTTCRWSSLSGDGGVAVVDGPLTRHLPRIITWVGITMKPTAVVTPRPLSELGYTNLASIRAESLHIIRRLYEDGLPIERREPHDWYVSKLGHSRPPW